MEYENSDDSYHGYIRLATQDDVPALQDIYAYYVDNTVVSFEYEAPNEEEFRRRFLYFSSLCPYLVYCENGKIMGYAYAHPAFERAAYAWCAESTVYVARESKGRGIGRALYRALTKMLAFQGYRIVYAVIVAENEESCAFHRKNGFQLRAMFKNAGFKFNRWLDVAWYELILGDFSTEIQRPIPFTDVPLETSKRICDEASRL